MWNTNIEKRYRTGRIAAGTARTGMIYLCAAVMCMLLLCGCGSSGHEEMIPLEKAAEGQNGRAGGSFGQQEDLQTEESTPGSEQGMIYIHVCGAVKEPGVVKLPPGSRVQDAVLAAGGFCEDADPDFVNLAAFLTDGEQLYIPTGEETAAGYTAACEGTQSSLINLNTADAGMLCTLPGIGESRARDIIAYREQHGGFSAAEEIMQVPGIKESTYEKLKDLITVK